MKSSAVWGLAFGALAIFCDGILCWLLQGEQMTQLRIPHLNNWTYAGGALRVPTGCQNKRHIKIRHVHAGANRALTIRTLSIRSNELGSVVVRMQIVLAGGGQMAGS